MIIAIPNYFLEQNNSKILRLNEGMYIEYTPTSPNKVYIRNTMHGILIVQKGEKSLEMEEDAFVLEALQIMLFSQGNYFSSENSKEYKGMVIFFDDRFISEFFKKYPWEQSGDQKNMYRVEYTHLYDIRRSVDAIEDDLKDAKEYQTALLKLKVETLLLQIFQNDKKGVQAYLESIQQTSSERMRYILEQNLDMIESVEDMYRLTRMSPTAFTKKFRSLFGKRPKTWLDEQRMQKAALLLQSTSKSIAEIATDCGYATASWFIVQFKKYYNFTPKEYRNKNRYK